MLETHRLQILSDEPFPLNSKRLNCFHLNSKPFSYPFRLLIKRGWLEMRRKRVFLGYITHLLRSLGV